MPEDAESTRLPFLDKKSSISKCVTLRKYEDPPPNRATPNRKRSEGGS